MSTFVWLKPRVLGPKGIGLLHAVGITTSPQLIMRLWAQERGRPRGGATHPLEGDLDPWLDLKDHATIMIKPGDPDYDVWWAWYVACQLAPETNPQPPLGGDA